MHLLSRYDSCIRAYGFLLVQLLDIFLQLVYIVAFYFLQLSGQFHQMLVVLSISILLRATMSFCTVISWLTSVEANDVLQLWLYTDYISSNFSSCTVTFLALHRCLLFKSPKWNLKVFGGYSHLHLLTGILVYSVIIARLQILTGCMQRDFSLEFGLIDFKNDSNPWHFPTMIIFFAYPIAAIICYIVLFLHIKKIRSQRSNQNKKSEENFAIQILINCVLQLVLYGLNEIGMALPEKIRFQLSIDVFTSYAAYIPEMVLPLFLLTSKVELRERIDSFKANRGNPFVVSNFY